MKIEFDKDQHQYYVNNDIARISVTQLLRKHHLAPEYKGVSDATLENAAKRGTAIHKDLELLITKIDYDPLTVEGENFKRYIDEFIDCATAEQLLAYNYKGMWVCGTADVVGFFKNKEKGCFVADHKTTSAINREYVSWQVSILDYMLRQLKEPINGKKIAWEGANEFLCFHYSKDGDLNVIKLNKVADSEIERLFEAEYNGEIYQRNELAIDDEIIGNMANVLKAMDTLNERLDALKKQEKAYKDMIKEKMEEQGIKSFECDQFKITYKYPQEKMVVDNAKLKKEFPEIYTKCVKVSKVNAQVQITLREGKDEEN